MPRTQQLLYRIGGKRSAIGVYEVKETYTHRCDTPDGKVLRHDGRNLWMAPGMAYYGPAPPGWDESKAYPEYFERSYETELDFS